jgi:chloramphenicol O-acetyltransferase type B
MNMDLVRHMNRETNSYIIGEIENIYKVEYTIGKYCSIAHGVRIIGGEHAIVANPEYVSQYPFETFRLPYDRYERGNPIVIGNDVWIGSYVSIKHGVTIGDGAVLGACSFVTKDVAPYEVVGGNPARHIRYRFTEEQIAELLRIKWWEWDVPTIKKRIRFFHDIKEFITAWRRGSE